MIEVRDQETGMLHVLKLYLEQRKDMNEYEKTVLLKAIELFGSPMFEYQPGKIIPVDRLPG